MFDLLFLLTVLWICICIAVIARLKRRERQAIRDIFLQVRQKTHASNNAVLLLNYKDPHLQQIDSLLTTIPESLVVIWIAPEWLVAAKRKSWERHDVLSAADLTNMDLSGASSKIIIGKKNKFETYDDIAATIRLFMSQSDHRLRSLKKRSIS